VVTAAKKKLQVKARVVTNPRTRGERQLSVFRSWKFNAAVIVFFDDDFRVWRVRPVRLLDQPTKSLQERLRKRTRRHPRCFNVLGLHA
jgi:hypothetical protein